MFLPRTTTGSSLCARGPRKHPFHRCSSKPAKPPRHPLNPLHLPRRQSRSAPPPRPTRSCPTHQPSPQCASPNTADAPRVVAPARAERCALRCASAWNQPRLLAQRRRIRPRTPRRTRRCRYPPAPRILCSRLVLGCVTARAQTPRRHTYAARPCNALLFLFILAVSSSPVLARARVVALRRSPSAAARADGCESTARDEDPPAASDWSNSTESATLPASNAIVHLFFFFCLVVLLLLLFCCCLLFTGLTWALFRCGFGCFV